MQLSLFLPPFLIAFVSSAILILIIISLPVFRQRNWRGGARHLGKKNISRLGGVAMLIAFIIAVLADPHLVISTPILGLLVGTGLVFVFGLWDDMIELGWKVQLFFQIALALNIFIFGMRITSLSNPLGGAIFFPDNWVLPAFLLLLCWLLLVMNSMNWLDGLDGLSGSVSLITFVTIFFLSLKPEVNQPPIAILS